jgi:hypothetical protein
MCWWTIENPIGSKRAQHVIDIGRGHFPYVLKIDDDGTHKLLLHRRRFDIIPQMIDQDGEGELGGFGPLRSSIRIRSARDLPTGLKTYH